MSPFQDYIRTELLFAFAEYRFTDDYYDCTPRMLSYVYKYEKHLPNEKEALKLFVKYNKEIKQYVGERELGADDSDLSIHGNVRYAFFNLNKIILNIIFTQMAYAVDRYIDKSDPKNNTVKRIREALLTQGVQFYDFDDFSEKIRANQLLYYR